MKHSANINLSSSTAQATSESLRPTHAQGQKPQGKFKTVSGASVGVPAASRILTASRPRGVAANFPSPPGVKAQHATRVAGILFCQPLKGADRSVQSRPDNSVHFSPESGRNLLDSSPVMNTLNSLFGPDPAQPKAEPRVLWHFEPKNSRRGETQEQRVIKAAAESYADNKPLATIDAIAGNDNVYRHFSHMMLKLANRPAIRKLPPAPIYDSHGRPTMAGRMAQDWVSLLTGGRIGNGQYPQVWTNCLRAADPKDRRNFLVTMVLDQEFRPLYKFISASGGLKPADIDANGGQISFQMRSADRFGRSVKLSAQRLSGPNDKECRIQQTINSVKTPYRESFTYIGYDDLLVRSPADRTNREIRILPRTLSVSSSKPNEVHDRARDTEYIAMSALSIIFQAGGLPEGVKPQIHMFSTNEMCSACEGATSIALTRPEFESVTDFVIYAANRN
jgi:hypothetical protein